MSSKTKTRYSPGPGSDLGPRYPEVASTLAVAVDRLHRRLRQVFSELLQREGGLSLPEWRVLVVLNNGGWMAQKDIVPETVMEQAQVSKALAKLERNGLVHVTAGESDRRVRRFALSPEGRVRHDALLPRVQAWRDHLDSALSRKARANFLAALQAIAECAATRPPV